MSDIPHFNNQRAGGILFHFSLLFLNGKSTSQNIDEALIWVRVEWVNTDGYFSYERSNFRRCGKFERLTDVCCGRFCNWRPGPLLPLLCPRGSMKTKCNKRDHR